MDDKEKKERKRKWKWKEQIDKGENSKQKEVYESQKR